MKPLKVYARLEPTTDASTLAMARWARTTTKKLDVRIYRDRACKELKGIFSWWNSRKPTRRNKYVTLNFYSWLIVWLKPKYARRERHAA